MTKDTGNAAITGLTMIVLSLLMIPFGSDSVMDTVISFILRDVLVSFEAGDEIKDPVSFAIAFVILLVSVIWVLFRKRRRRLNVIENINSDPGNAQEW